MTEVTDDYMPSEGARVNGSEESKDRPLRDNGVIRDAVGINERISSVGELSAVRAYLERVDAEMSGMLRAKIWDRSGRYPRASAVIEFDRNGSVKVRAFYAEAGDIAPNGVEADRIRNEVVGAKFLTRLFPYHLDKLTGEMQEAQRTDAGDRVPTHLFEFREPSGQRILMVQTRKDLRNNQKLYREWTYWEDGQWRNERPDKLPLWGLEQLKSHDTVIIHEGAKAAAFCRWMAEGKTREALEISAAHPWGKQLNAAAHVGWVGGAQAPDASDWNALATISRAYIVTDNDREGQSAVGPISKALAEAGVGDVWWVRFSDKFPPKFDLADAMPAEVPAFWECTFPATWATRALPPKHITGRGRPPSPQYALRQAFARQWAVIAEEGRSLFVHRKDTRRKYAEPAFNDRVRPFSDVRNTADLLKQDPACAFDGLAYRPGQKEAELNEGGRRMLNVWEGPRLQGDAGGDPGPWLNYLSHLFPDLQDRHEVCKWLATLIARPNVRMRYGLLLFSRTQGTGKSTMNAVLRKVLGSWNCSQPAEREVVESDYNDWISEKTLVFVNEIYAGSTWKAYRKLKEMISEDVVRVNKKFVPGYEIDLFAHFILCSNQSTGVTIENGDRRFLVPRITENLRPKEEWEAFYSWLAGDGPAIIVRWAQKFVEVHGAVRQADRAPMTERKQKLIEDSRSPAHRALLDLADAARARDNETGRFVALIDTEVANWIECVAPGAKLPLHIVREMLMEGGMFETGRVKIGGRKGQKRVCCVTSAAACRLGAAELQTHAVKPSDLMETDM